MYFIKTLRMITLFAFLAFMFITSAAAQTEIRVVPPRTDIPTSNDYEVSVAIAQNGDFQPAHVHFTKENWQGAQDDFGYNFHLEGYKMAYTNFEYRNGAAWVKVAVPNADVPDFQVRPNAKQAEVFYENENGFRIAKIKIQAPVDDYFATAYLSVVPWVNGEQQLENALGLFANPFQEQPSGPLVEVFPGENIPALTEGQTLVFKPGTHDIGANYDLMSGVNYFIENGAFVKGTFRAATVNNVRIHGLGILSQTHMRRYIDGVKQNNRTISLSGENIRVEGITIEDPRHHAIVLSGTSEAAPAQLRYAKVISWRANGDGLHITGYGVARDSFFRTQDDSVYVAAQMVDVRQERLVTWNDFNGSAFVFTHGGGGAGSMTLNSDVIYTRSRFSRNSPGAESNNDWEDYHGGAVFTLVGLSGDQVVENVLMRGIRIDDESPSRNIFSIRMQDSVFNETAPPTNNNSKFRNITFQNINAAAQGDYQQVMWSQNEGVFPENISFECVRMSGNVLSNLDGWKTQNLNLNEFSFNGCDNTLDDQNLTLTTNYWRLENKATGQWVRPLDCSGESGARLVVSSTLNDQDCTMFSFEPTEFGYHFINNKATNGRLKLVDNSAIADDTVPVELVGSDFNGLNPQWNLIDAGDGYYRIQNRVTSNWIRPQECSSEGGAAITQVSTLYVKDCTRWKLVDAGAINNLASNSFSN